jgi:hypothetical protein
MVPRGPHGQFHEAEQYDVVTSGDLLVRTKHFPEDEWSTLGDQLCGEIEAGNVQLDSAASLGTFAIEPDIDRDRLI